MRADKACTLAMAGKVPKPRRLGAKLGSGIHGGHFRLKNAGNWLTPRAQQEYLGLRPSPSREENL